MALTPTSNPGLLLASDPRPVEIVNPQSQSALLLTCEHAGRAVPGNLGNLGVAAADFERHIAYDIGAEPLARQLSVALDATLLIQPYSRLVIDCNRPFAAEDCIPKVSDGIGIPANASLRSGDRQQRYDEIHAPFHAQVARELNQRRQENRLAKLISVHSFTPLLETNPQDRPWHIGLLHDNDDRIARPMMTSLQQRAPELKVAYNQPYTIDPKSDYTIPVHAQNRELASLLLEIRNDQLGTAEDHSRFTNLLTAVIIDVLETLR